MTRRCPVDGGKLIKLSGQEKKKNKKSVRYITDVYECKRCKALYIMNMKGIKPTVI